MFWLRPLGPSTVGTQHPSVLGSDSKPHLKSRSWCRFVKRGERCYDVGWTGRPWKRVAEYALVEERVGRGREEGVCRRVLARVDAVRNVAVFVSPRADGAPQEQACE